MGGPNNQLEKFESQEASAPKSKINRENGVIFALNVTCLISYILMIFMNAASTFPSWGLFKNTNADVSNKYLTNITPSGWTFSTWGIIYTWQALWIIFSFASIFIKKNPYGYLYDNPIILTPIFFAFMISNFIFNIAWLFVFTELKFWGGFVLLLCIALTLYGALVITHKNIYEASVSHRKDNYIWAYRILVNNGLAFYATWVTIATMLNFAIALEHESGVARETAANASLSIVTVILVAYFALDVYILEKYLRYTLSTYVQLLIAFAGVLDNNWNTNADENPSSAKFVLSLIIIAPGLMFFIKIILVFKKILNEKKIVIENNNNA